MIIAEGKHNQIYEMSDNFVRNISQKEEKRSLTNVNTNDSCLLLSHPLLFVYLS